MQIRDCSQALQFFTSLMLWNTIRLILQSLDSGGLSPLVLIGHIPRFLPPLLSLSSLGLMANRPKGKGDAHPDTHTQVNPNSMRNQISWNQVVTFLHDLVSLTSFNDRQQAVREDKLLCSKMLW